MTICGVGQETNARRSNKPDSQVSAQAPAAQQNDPRGKAKKGAKFAEIKAQEAARRAAKTVASGLAQAGGQLVPSWLAVFCTCSRFLVAAQS